MSGIGTWGWLTRCLHEVVQRTLRWIREVYHLVAASREGLDPRQRATLDVGSWLVVGTLGLGLQVGRWSVWSVLVAAAGYLIWVIAYSEATVQATRRQPGG